MGWRGTDSFFLARAQNGEHRLEGRITLVLDTQEAHLKAGEIVVQRGTNHAWSNRSSSPAVVVIVSHDGAEDVA